MGILKIIAVSYRRPIALRLLCDSFRVQTNPNWELHICHDGSYPGGDLDLITNQEPKISDDKRIFFYNSAKRKGEYGHPNRKQMLDRLECKDDDFILLTNDDNYYVPHFVERVMSAAAKTVGMVYCDMLHNYYSYEVLRTELAVNHIDMGAFAVRASVAKKVGFNSTKFEADGIYAVECMRYCQEKGLRTIKIKGILFVHN